MHGQQTCSLLDRKAALLVGFYVKMGDPGIPLIEKILFPCGRKLGGTHGMHLRTSADHSHLNLSVRKPELLQTCLENVAAPRNEANVKLSQLRTASEPGPKGGYPGVSHRTVEPRREKECKTSPSASEPNWRYGTAST